MSCADAISFQRFQLAKDQKPGLMYRVALRIAKITSDIILAGMLSNNTMNIELT
jgi:hypothetical protein